MLFGELVILMQEKIKMSEIVPAFAQMYWNIRLMS